MKTLACLLFALLVFALSGADAVESTPWPKLPEKSGKIEIEVRDGLEQTARKLDVHINYPRSRLLNVTSGTGLMLSLHNWGGTVWDNAPSPGALSENYDLLVIGVTYYQSGDRDGAIEPYDFSYRQAMDAIRALRYVYQELKDSGHPFDATRIYCTGGSGGGHVSQMANKFAPNTFACIVDLSGMAALTDDIAYNLPGGSPLNARYSRDPASPNYLSADMQEIRDIGNPAHLALQAKSANRCKIVVIHGEDDPVCLASDKHRAVDAMQAAGLDVEPHFVTKAEVDGKLFINSGHQIGERTGLLMHFAGRFLSPGSDQMCRLTTPCDFERHSKVSYPTSNGVHTVSYLSDKVLLTFLPRK